MIFEATSLTLNLLAITLVVFVGKGIFSKYQAVFVGMAPRTWQDGCIKCFKGNGGNLSQCRFFIYIAITLGKDLKMSQFESTIS